MAPAPLRRQSIQRAAIILISSCALAGVAACLLGALQWGLLGLALGLVGSWIVFLSGLLALYRREQHSRRSMEELTTTAEPATVRPPSDPAKLA